MSDKFFDFEELPVEMLDKVSGGRSEGAEEYVRFFIELARNKGQSKDELIMHAKDPAFMSEMKICTSDELLAWIDKYY